MENCEKKGRCMMVNLDILQAKNVMISLIRGRDNLFVQYYLFTNNGEENNIAMSFNKVMEM